MKILPVLDLRLEEWEAAYWHTKEEFAVFVIAIMTLTQHPDVFFVAIKGMEVGKGTFPSTTAAPASAHLSDFFCKNTWEVALKSWHYASRVRVCCGKWSSAELPML